MSAPTLGRIVNHRELALAALTEHFRGKPNIAALLGSFSDRVQELEHVIWDVLESRTLTWVSGYQVPWIGGEGADTLVDAQGEQLDLIGALIGKKRDGRTDAAYQQVLRVELLVKRSRGLPEDLIAIARAILTLDGGPIYYSEGYPANVTISFNPGTILDDYQVFERAKAAGVRILVATGVAPNAMLTGWDNEPSLTIPSGMGWDLDPTGDPVMGYDV